MNTAELDYLASKLTAHRREEMRYSVDAAAEQLKISRTKLYDLMKHHNLRYTYAIPPEPGDGDKPKRVQSVRIITENHIQEYLKQWEPKG